MTERENTHRPETAGHEVAGSRIATTWNQPAEGGRQTPEGSGETSGEISGAAGPDAGSGAMDTRNDGSTQAPGEAQEVSDLQSLPVLAAVSGSLQQSGSAQGAASAVIDGPTT